MNETEWQRQVVELARIYHWWHLHVRRSIGRGRRWVTTTNIVGWPDLLLWHEGQRRIIGAELKTETGRLTAEQFAVLGSLNRAGVETYVWYPGDLEDVHRILKGGRSPATLG